MNRNKNKYHLFIFVFIVLTLIAFYSGYFIFSREGSGVQKKPEIINNGAIESEKFYRSLDGIEVKNQDEKNPNLMALTVDNFIDSRPVSGLSHARVVYEALAEAGITRFLAIYPLSDLENIRKIGPIRSARPYFLDLAEEYKSVFMHVGGSPAAIISLKEKEYNLYDLDQFFNAQYFWREKTRKAPFNVYTSTDLFKRFFSDRQVKNNVIQGWQFKDEPVPADLPITGKNLTINYSTPEYKIKWQYNKETNDYLREEGGKVYLEEEDREIKAKNIVVQITETSILDEVGRKDIKTTGEGNAFIFEDGKVIEGIWQKLRKGDRTKFFDQDNNEIRLNRGITWVEIVPNVSMVSF